MVSDDQGPSNILNMALLELWERMVERRFLLFAPDRSGRDLRSQYPELLEYPEFKSHVLKPYDMLFVWWYSCASSPIFDKEDAVRLPEAIHMAYPSDQMRIARLAEFEDKFPENIAAAIKRMASFNLAARVETYVQTKMVRENCTSMLAANVSAMGADEKEAWAKRAPGLYKLMEETTRAIERGAYGVTTYEETNLDEADGTLRAFRQTRR